MHLDLTRFPNSYKNRLLEVALDSGIPFSRFNTGEYMDEFTIYVSETSLKFTVKYTLLSSRTPGMKYRHSDLTPIFQCLLGVLFRLFMLT